MFPGPCSRSLASIALCLALAGAARADTITLTDGKVLENVTVVAETLRDVTFKRDGKSGSVLSDNVISVEFVTKPRLVGQADADARDGDFEGALATLETYLDGLAGGSAKEPLLWAPSYAMQRRLELTAALGDSAAVVKAADRLIGNAKDSRYLPAAYLNKAEAQRDGQRPMEAAATLAQLRELIESRSLGPRWKLEAELAETLSDPALDAAARRARAILIGERAALDCPTVSNRAKLAVGESFIAAEPQDFASALPLFRQIVADPSADGRTLAGACTGLGDCLFARALDPRKARQDAQACILEAAESYMRVVILAPEQLRYRPKAMFQAARALEFLADDAGRARARQLYRALMRDYKSSPWAGEARKQMGG